MQSRGLALSLSAGPGLDHPDFSLLDVSVALTALGMEVLVRLTRSVDTLVIVTRDARGLPLHGMPRSSHAARPVLFFFWR